jgi:hypothetical protein
MRNSHNILFEKYMGGVVNPTLGEARKGPSTAVTDLGTKAMNLKFGKYNLIKGEDTAVTTFDKAVQKGYIASGSLENINTLIGIGFKFDKAYFIVKSVGAPSTMVHGVDPDGEEFYFIRKGGNSMVPPYLYYKTKYGPAGRFYNEIVGKNPSLAGTIPTEEILKNFLNITGRRLGSKVILNPDGSYDIVGEIHIRNFYQSGIKKVPLPTIPIKFNKITGGFFDHSNGALPLENYPREVYGYFNVNTNGTSLENIQNTVVKNHGREGFDTSAGGHFTYDASSIAIMDCPNLVSLKFFPKTDSSTSVDINQCPKLINLEGLPQKIAGSLSIQNCDGLRSLKGAPARIDPSYRGATLVPGGANAVLRLYQINSLETLHYAPAYNGPLFLQHMSKLRSLEGASRIELTHFALDELAITNLAGLPSNMVEPDITSTGSSSFPSVFAKTINNTIRNCEELVTLHGTPDGIRTLSIMRCPALKNLNGLPRNMVMLMIENCSSLNTLEGLPDVIEGDLQISNCPGITEGVLTYYAVGDVVKGDIYVGEEGASRFNSHPLDKSRYTRAIRDAILKGDQDANVNLDI